MRSMAPSVVELEQGLSLLPRTRLLLEFTRTDTRTLLKPIDEWHVKEWVRTQVKKGLKLEVGDKDLERKQPAAGVAICWELLLWYVEADRVNKYLVPLLDAVELNVAGVRLRCKLQQQADDFSSLEAAVGNLRPDTLVIAGVPCRWFAEPRVSTRASPLVTHTVFSKFGRIKNLEIVEDPDQPLQCKIWIQFDQHSSWGHAAQALCGRSMQKDGSSLKATYTVDWDNGDYFNVNNIRKRRFERERAEKLANDERLMQAQKARAAEQARQVEAERVARALREEEEKRRREEEETRRKEEEERRREEQERLRKEEEERQLAEERRRREEEEAFKKAQEEEEARKAEMHRQLVERKNQEIREATRRLLEEQARRKQEEEERKRQQAEEARRKHEEEEPAVFERWQLYLKEGEPWSPSSCQVQVVAARGCTKRRLRSVVVGALQSNTRA